MFERFTAKAVNSLKYAQEEMRRLQHNFLGTEAILLGIIAEKNCLAAKALTSFGVDLTTTRIEVEKIIERGTGPVAAEIPFTPRSKRVLELSWNQAKQLGHDYIGPEHLLLGLLSEADGNSAEETNQGVAVRVMRNMGVDLSVLRARILHLLGHRQMTIEEDTNDEVRKAMKHAAASALHHGGEIRYALSKEDLTRSIHTANDDFAADFRTRQLYLHAFELLKSQGLLRRITDERYELTYEGILFAEEAE